VGQRDDSFSEFIGLGDKRESESAILFDVFSNGAKTNRDAWVYNSSKPDLTKRLQSMIAFYNGEVARYKTASKNSDAGGQLNADDFVNSDSTKFSWSDNLKRDLKGFKTHNLNSLLIRQSQYRPYTKQWLYADKSYIDRLGQMGKIFPSEQQIENRVICLTGRGSTKDFSAFISDVLPDYEMVSKGQCFPLRVLEETQGKDLFGDCKQGTMKDGISDAGLQHFKAAYKGESISKEDLFYYIYGLLHSEDYKKRYADNLSKELPRIPAVKKFADFQAFSAAGRKLADLHIGYESVTPYPVEIEGGALLLSSFTDADYRVTQMKFPSKTDKTRVIYNHKITMIGIPLEAYDYVVNGKPRFGMGHGTPGRDHP
jgi:predicted helicase